MTAKEIQQRLEPLGCRLVGDCGDRPMSLCRRLGGEVGKWNERILYLGRPEEFASVGFPESCCGLSVPPSLSFDTVYEQLEQGWTQAAAEHAALSRLITALWNGKSLQKIVALASELLENPVTLHDFAFLPLTDPPEDAGDSVNPRLREEFLQAAQACQSAWYNAHRAAIDEDMPQVYHVGDQRWILSAVKIERVTVAWIVVSQVYRALSDRDIALVQLLRNVISTYFMTEKDYHANTGGHQDIFLRDLLSGAYRGRASMERMKRQLRLPSHDRYCMIAVQWLSGTPDNNSLHSILQQIRLLMPNNPTIFHERYFAILLGQKQDAGGLLNSNYVLREFLAINKLQGAMSQPFSDLMDAPRYFAQAISTLEALGKLYPQELLIRYGMNLALQMIHDLAKHADVRLFRHPAVEILQDYDRLNAAELARTLEVYLEVNGSPSAACRALFIHRNTLAKRLQKIRELTGVDLNDGRTVTQLGLTCAINLYLQVNTP